MANPKISLIAVIGKNHELGKNNKLVWHIPKDLKFFHRKTKGHVVVMGHKTYQSIGRPLEDRINIVLSHDDNLQIAGCIVANSLKDALKIAKDKEKSEMFIIGGAKIYSETLPLANKLYLTVIDGTFEADVFFPEYKNFKVIKESEEFSYQNYRYRFLELTPKGR